jgi:hypothetical protein
MGYKSSIGIIARTVALLAALCVTFAGAFAFDQTKYPDWAGQWVRFKGAPGNFDPTKPRRAQQAPLTPEYQAIYEANLRDQDEGKQGADPTYTCLSPGMPRIMNIYEPMEIVITPETTHVLTQHIHDARRIFTDGRDWPVDENASFAGYSIGKWIDLDGDGRFDELDVETRGLKGPRTFDSTGIPMARDNETVVKERLYLDKANPDMLHNEITTFDHALTHPWTITKNYRRTKSKEPIWWREAICTEGNPHVRIGDEFYMVSADGKLMPTRKDQAAPDLKYFRPPQK